MDVAADPLFARPPEEIRALIHRQGALQPAGGLLYGEADTRNFHEVLFVIHQTVTAEAEGPARLQRLITALLAYYAGRFRGWYGLEEAARRIEASAAALDYGDKAAFLVGLEDLMAVAGRINFWIDAQMPWFEINETLKRVVRGSEGPADLRETSNRKGENR
jgi:hypothetical protein